MIIHLLLTTKMHRKMHQNEELLQIDCSMEKEEGENRTLVRGFLWLLHFKVTKVGNWLEAVVVPKPVGGKRTNAFQNHRV